MGNAVQIAGHRFGKLVAVKPTGGKYGSSIAWLCRCDCGKDAVGGAGQLRAGQRNSCGCENRRAARDIAGQTFGALTAIAPTPRRISGAVAWSFRCVCGEVVERGGAATAATAAGGATPSCGCINRDLASPMSLDMRGARYGRLTMISYEDSSAQGLRWRCECDCGNFTVARVKDIRAGTTTSCGCRRGNAGVAVGDPGRIYGRGKAWRAPTVFPGDKFGLLTVQDEASVENGSRHYLCRCDCGGQTIVRGGLLRTGQTKSCGCLRRQSAAKRIDHRGREYQTADKAADSLRATPEMRLGFNAPARLSGLVACESA